MFFTIGVAFDFPKLLIQKLEISLFTPCYVTDEDSESKGCQQWSQKDATAGFSPSRNVATK